MRIALEMTATELDHGGTARAIDQLSHALENEPSVELLRVSQGGNAGSGRLGVLARGLRREGWYFPVVLPRRIRKLSPDVLHCPSSLVPISSPVPMVVTLHDAIGWDHPEWLTRANVLQLKHVLPRALKGGSRVITSSEYSRSKLVEHLGVDAERVHVVAPGIDPMFSAAGTETDAALVNALGVENRFVLTVGTLQPRKNLEAAIAAFEQLGDEYSDVMLVVVGARGWRDDSLQLRLSSSPAGDRILALGRVTDAELVALYRASDCLLFTSRYEGFGFPPLEAMASGTAVISTDNTSIGEVIGDAALVIDPDDIEGIADALDRVLGSLDLRTQLAEAGLARASGYTPDAYLRATLDVYEAAIADQS